MSTDIVRTAGTRRLFIKEAIGICLETIQEIEIDAEVLCPANPIFLNFPTNELTKIS